MPSERIRIAADGQPAPCVVRIPPVLSAFIYREKRRGNYRDETELVAAIVREWAKGREAVDWPALRAELQAEAATAAGEAAGESGAGKGGEKGGEKGGRGSGRKRS